MEDLDTELLGQLQRWHEEDQYQRIIDAIEAIPQPERGYELTCQLARAYNNLAGPEEAGPLEKSVSLLESIADQGQEDPLWHYRLGYALFYLDREEEALPHFQRAAELDPQDPDAAEFIRQCQKYIAAKQCYPHLFRIVGERVPRDRLPRHPCGHLHHPPKPGADVPYLFVKSSVALNLS